MARKGAGRLERSESSGEGKVLNAERELRNRQNRIKGICINKYNYTERDVTTPQTASHKKTTHNNNSKTGSTNNNSSDIRISTNPNILSHSSHHKSTNHNTISHSDNKHPNNTNNTSGSSANNNTNNSSANTNSATAGNLSRQSSFQVPSKNQSPDLSCLTNKLIIQNPLHSSSSSLFSPSGDESGDENVGKKRKRGEAKNSQSTIPP